MNGWNWRNYSIFRFVFGAYLFVHFAELLPWASELFSGEGIMAAGTSPLISPLPSLFMLSDSPVFAIGLLCASLALSLMLALGFRDRIASAALWVIWAALFCRNPMIANPGLPFVGWLLLFHTAVPVPKAGEAGTWRLPRGFYTLSWVMMSAGYTFSGITKLHSQSWIDGSALQYVLESALSRDNLIVDALTSMPVVLTGMSYGVLALECLFAPLAVIARFRPWLWLAMVGMHLGILATIDFADLTLGMLLIHIITFNPEWLNALRGAKSGAAERV